MLVSRLGYYLVSITTIVLGIRNWHVMLALLLGLPVRKPATIVLRDTRLRFKVRTALDIWIIKETCLDRDYERAGTRLEDGWTIVDIGAALGDFAVYAARENPRSVVYAYEPFPESFALLRQNVELNGLGNIRMFPCAVAGHDAGRLKLRTGAEPVQHSTVSHDDSPIDKAVEVPSTTLNQIFEDSDLRQCDFMKIDCEGAEYEILFAAGDETLQKIKRLCLEYHDGVTPYSHTDLAGFLRDKGFRVSTRPNPVHLHLGFLYASRV